MIGRIEQGKNVAREAFVGVVELPKRRQERERINGLIAERLEKTESWRIREEQGDAGEEAARNIKEVIGSRMEKLLKREEVPFGNGKVILSLKETPLSFSSFYAPTKRDRLLVDVNFGGRLFFWAVHPFLSITNRTGTYARSAEDYLRLGPAIEAILDLVLSNEIIIKVARKKRPSPSEIHLPVRV
jgi:hypothetical protein